MSSTIVTDRNLTGNDLAKMDYCYERRRNLSEKVRLIRPTRFLARMHFPEGACAAISIKKKWLYIEKQEEVSFPSLCTIFHRNWHN